MDKTIRLGNAAYSWVELPASPSTRIGFTSDVHYDPTNRSLTSAAQVEALVAQLQEEKLDLLVLAGDLGHRLEVFSDCLAFFSTLGIPVAVLAGNHDLWRDERQGHASEALWEELLPAVTQEHGFIWLEDSIVRVGEVALVGSIAWYDYSGIDDSQDATEEMISTLKRLFNNDANWIDWARRDVDFAATCRRGLQERLAYLDTLDEIQQVVVATHVPVFEEQMLRRPEDANWAFANAYFGHLTLGQEILTQPKVRTVVSGHLHYDCHAMVARPQAPAIEAYVIPSHYTTPRAIVLEVPLSP